MNKTLPKALAAVFLALLALLILWPLLAATGLVGANGESYENRRLATFPTQIASLEDYVKWPRRVDDFLGDQLPNRGTLLGLNAWIRYHVFATSPVDSVLVGRDGWLFHRMPADIQEAEGRLVRKPYQIRRLRIVLEERRDWLAEQGIDYLVLVAPTKQTVYPEKLPAWLKPVASGSSRRELLIEALRRSGSDVALFDFTPALRQARTKWGDALYYRQDTHWTYRGALEAYAALAAHAPEWFRAPARDWIEVETPRESNLMHLMGLAGQEITGQPQPPGGFAARAHVLDTPLLKRMASRGVALAYQRPDRRGPRLYLLGDSFAGWNTAYLAENFSRTVVTNTWGDQWQRHEQFPTENILAERPDLVIEQMLENRLDLGIPRALLGDPASDNHPAEVRSARLRRLMHNAGEAPAEHRRVGDEIEIQKPPAAGRKARALIVRIGLDAPAPTQLESVSPYPETAAWDDLCRRGGELTRRAVGPGRSEVLLCVPVRPGSGAMRVRLDPASPARILGVTVARHPDV
jgi:hypothetical protein